MANGNLTTRTTLRILVRILAVPLLIGSACLSVFSGCAQERAPINRVQAAAMEKSFFVGPKLDSTEDDPEFYKRGTVVNVPFGAGQEGLFSSTYAQPVSRVRWEITETTLNARLSYEQITGTDNTGTRYAGVQLKPTNDGQVVASYKIVSHFDIKREYNPQTGEQLNVVGENTSDRPWYQRQHFRVDWSKNLVSTSYDYDTLTLLGVIGGVTYEPFAYTVLDPTSPDAPHFDAPAGYFDVTNKVYAKPGLVDLAQFGESGVLPACLLNGARVTGGTSPIGNCNPIELTIRESYRKVTDTDYEPENFDGVRFQALGAFNFDYRRNYARNYGLLDSEWSRFIARYNIWEKSHFYSDPGNAAGPKGELACATKATTQDPTGNPKADPNRDADNNGTADECEDAGSGSRCDVFTNKCTLPYRERKAKVIPWYIAGDTSLFEPTNWAVVEWDLAMRTAVQTARLAECRRTRSADCDSLYPMWKGQQDDIDEAARLARQMDACHREKGWTSPGPCDEIATAGARAVATERGNAADRGTLAIGEVLKLAPVIVLCHNPVAEGDHPICGKAGLEVRPGDIRYNTVYNIPNPQVPSPWGILADGNDPLTGEKVAGSMNIWTAITDSGAQALVDMVRYINGEIATADITNGTYIQNWAAAAKLSSASALPTMSREEVNRRLSAGTTLDPQAFKTLTAGTPPAEIKAAVAAGRVQVADVRARNDVPSPSMAKLHATLNLMRGTPVESQLLNPAILQLAGKRGTGSLSGPIPPAISPLALNNPLFGSRLHQMRENALAARGACVIDEAPEPSSMTALAAILGKKFPKAANETPAAQQARYSRMFKYVQHRYHYAVLAHEMGHSIGLRHNFVSSSASLFYRPQYWQLRTKNGKVEAPCTDAVADGATCTGPRYFDPLTEEEQSQLIWMWMQSTVMEYPGDSGQNFLGLGVTDFAAARFFYSDIVSVYDSPDYKPMTAIGAGIAEATDTFGGLLGIRYGMRGAVGAGTDEFHYSQLQKNYKVISGCVPVKPAAPAGWDEAISGVWDPVLDGHVVSVDGQFTKCRQQPVDYVGFGQLRPATATEANGVYSGGPNVDPATMRLRVPYAFATDNWADTGNVSVFRNDNGADPYEQVQFLISTQENRHIFDNYRRGRSSFSLIAATDRSFSRYMSKIHGLSQGMSFYASIYRDIATNQGYAFDTLWPVLVQNSIRENVLAATVAFDHFARALSRPEPGPHYRRPSAFEDFVLRAANSPDDYGPDRMQIMTPPLVVPNGTTGFLRDVGFGGRPLENALSTNMGDFDSEYLQNAGSYYDKINTAILFALSEDRFISSSRRDFYDARFRAVGLADVLPDGFRRVLANALTGDRSILGPRVATDAAGAPILDTGATSPQDPLVRRYPKTPMGWVSFWPPAGPEVCFPSDGRNVCSNYAGTDNFAPLTPPNMAPVDPQVGWEVQKFLIAWTVALITANEKTQWTDSMRIWRLGQNANPDITPRIEWQDPVSGEVYYARSMGTECLFGNAAASCAGGKIVQKGIAARVLEYANQLTAGGYKLNTTAFPATATSPAGFNAFGRAMVVRHPNGTPVVKGDPAIRNISPDGTMLIPIAECDQNITPACTPLSVTQNHWAHELTNYKSVPDFLWQVEASVGWFNSPGVRGIF